MNAVLEMCEEDELGYEVEVRRGAAPRRDRCRLDAMRELSGRERASLQSRYSRRPTPTRTSGSHRRGNKRYGI